MPEDNNLLAQDEASIINAGDYLYLVQGGLDKKVSFATLVTSLSTTTTTTTAAP